MQKQLKILIIRFSSIGDIILTTPIIRAIKKQTNAEIHYLTKAEYISVLISNPYIDQFYTDKINQKLFNNLKANKYDYILDLHNNLRSLWVRLNLRVRSFVVEKETLRRLLFIYLGINTIKYNIVQRYFKTIESLNIISDQQGLDYFIKDDYEIDYDVNQRYISWCIGGSYEQKRLSAEQIIEVCKKLKAPIVLLGGKGDFEMALKIMDACKKENLYNFCGKLTLDESAYMIKKSQLLLTNDTSLMHIGSAFKIPLISFWGCTKPALGFKPYLANKKSIELISDKSQKPCSKHGSVCRYDSIGCVKSIETNNILNAIQSIYKF